MDAFSSPFFSVKSVRNRLQYAAVGYLVCCLRVSTVVPCYYKVVELCLFQYDFINFDVYQSKLVTFFEFLFI
jgi:hypothetical protein